MQSPMHDACKSPHVPFWSFLCKYWTWYTQAHYSLIVCFLSRSIGLELNTWCCGQYQSLCLECQPEAWGLRCILLLHTRGKDSECPTDCVTGWRGHQLEDVRRCHCEWTYRGKGRCKKHIRTVQLQPANICYPFLSPCFEVEVKVVNLFFSCQNTQSHNWQCQLATWPQSGLDTWWVIWSSNTST